MIDRKPSKLIIEPETEFDSILTILEDIREVAKIEVKAAYIFKVDEINSNGDKLSHPKLPGFIPDANDTMTPGDYRQHFGKTVPKQNKTIISQKTDEGWFAAYRADDNIYVCLALTQKAAKLGAKTFAEIYPTPTL